MCGILGHYGNYNLDSFNKQLMLLNHRGPDGNGIKVFPKVILGHTRLSFLDLTENGSQPMSSMDERHSIVFNGEIYNHDELRKQLINLGVNFQTSTDTEVILEGYKIFGQEYFRHIEGMYALLIYDCQRDELVIARDEFGMKPLYYRISAEGIELASEVRALSSGRSISDRAAVLFMMSGSIPEPYTISEEILAFPAGNVGIYRRGHLSIYPVVNNSLNEENSIKKVLNNHIRQQLKSDAKIGVFLSGGIDSSIITALASKQNGKVVTTSVNWKSDTLPSEKKEQRLVSKLYQTSHGQLDLTKEVFSKELEGFLNAMDQPTVDGFNTYLVSGLSRKFGMKGMLSGIGADELFAGYPSFRKFRFLGIISPIVKCIPVKYLKGKLGRLDYVRFGKVGCYYALRSLYTPKEISTYLKLEEDVVDGYLKEYFDLMDKELGLDTWGLKSIRALELKLYMKNQLLKDADVFGMARSIEIRLPFLHRQLVDIADCTPSFKMLSFRRNKPILIKEFKDLLPRQIYARKKKGFVLPFKEWMLAQESDSNDGVEEHWSRSWVKRVLFEFRK